MFDTEKLQALATGVVAKDVKTVLAEMDEGQLRALRAELDTLIPERSLSGMNLEDELVWQFAAIKQLQDRVMVDDATPANQKAQVANAVAGTLQNLIKMQTDYHTAERFKAIEGLMVRAMKRLPLEAAQAFLDEYEAL